MWREPSRASPHPKLVSIKLYQLTASPIWKIWCRQPLVSGSDLSSPWQAEMTTVIVGEAKSTLSMPVTPQPWTSLTCLPITHDSLIILMEPQCTSQLSLQYHQATAPSFRPWHRPLHGQIVMLQNSPGHLASPLTNWRLITTSWQCHGPLHDTVSYVKGIINVGMEKLGKYSL